MSSITEVIVLVEGHTELKFINNSETAPSKRLLELTGKNFKKTTTGIAIAKKIGIPRMRERCPLFNEWVGRMESLAP